MSPATDRRDPAGRPREIVLASGNPHKAAELQALAQAAGLEVRIVSAADRGGMPAVEENAGTFLGNARLKARALASQLGEGVWVLADDSGLCVDALGGAPGVESAYYAGPAGDSAANRERLVRELRGVPEGKRSAYFICQFVLLGPGGREETFLGRCDGRLREKPAGEGGFGYDPLFVPAGETLTFAEMPAERKNALSHRGRAWAQLAEWLGSPDGE